MHTLKSFLVESVVSLRNSLTHFLYRIVLKPIFFRNDPEMVHDHMIAFGAMLGRNKILRSLTGVFFNYHNRVLTQNILGIHFENPIGLAAGFDKNAELTDILPAVGFGFEEVGSITGKPCTGNNGKRLWRLPQSKGLIVNYGLKNDGAEAIAHRLKQKHFHNKIGTSVAMTNCKDNVNIKNAVCDYAQAFKAFTAIGDYFTINISCPNAVGGQPFVTPYRLDYLLDILDEIPTKKPIFLKLSPDLTLKTVNEILDVSRHHRVHGIICTNLSKKKDNPAIIEKDIPNVGGVSGKPVEKLSNNLLAYIYKREGKRFILIGCGGVFSAEDAYKKIRLGASLIQMITGMIYEGPQLVSDINQGLKRLLERDGFKNIGDAIGVDNVQAA